MPITNPSRPGAHIRSPTFGPQMLFGMTVFAVFAVLTGAITAVPADLLAPLASTMLLVAAAVAALAGWLRGRQADIAQVTYWDVAGALTLVGIGAATLVDPDQLVRVFDGAPREK